jgi:type I restriction enzyme, R subunit
VGAVRLLRDAGFQNLLVDCPRRKKVFIKAIENEDTVESEYLIRDGQGKEYKPGDYLEAFDRFVRENPVKIEAIRILLDRPRDWSTAALTELRNKLVMAPERFTVELLQKAHAVRYDKSLADIISMVKHAARNEEPLLTAAERVDRAMAGIVASREFTPEQRQWLDRIREHLAENLSIDREDFEFAPVLARAGGWKPADRTFEGKLETLLKALNEAVAA